jgi:methylmalonyl-CoA mutase C-terminal domain/subunit
MAKRKRRVLIAKAGLDGHERGARTIARVLSNAGMEVVYLGFHPQGVSPQSIVSAAIEEDVDLIVDYIENL